MGRTTRWLKGLFGIKKDKHQQENSNSGDRKQSGFGQSGRDTNGLCHNPATIPPNLSPAEASWIKSFYTDSDEEQNKHAIAVAAATAAAADAAVAAAQAAAAVVRLTSQGRGTMFGGSGREKLAAIKIQSLFRGYLSRRALRALKGLVKLQALVRGFLVRKQATATLYGMQALIRAQASVRAQKNGYAKHEDERSKSQFRPRKSVERFDDTRSELIHSRRLSSSFETPITTIDENPKIVEVDPGRPKSRSRRTNTWASDSGDYQYAAPPLSSPLPHPHSRLSVLNCRSCLDTDWATLSEECRFSTAQSTPRFAYSGGSNGPATPSKSVCAAESFFYGDGTYHPSHPNYMSSTKSFKAKLRSHSAPKQRPELGHKKRVSMNEMMESRNSISGGIKMQRSGSQQAQEVVSFKNAVMGKIGNKSSEFVREGGEREYYYM